MKYILGPVEVAGATIADADAHGARPQQGVATGEWAVNIEFNGEGTEQFAEVTHRLVRRCEPDVAATSSPSCSTARSSPRRTHQRAPSPTASRRSAETSRRSRAKTLADQLKFGALPISFKVQSTDTISATLGTAQLQSGLIAGLIGLLLVVIYSLFQYRPLGLGDDRVAASSPACITYLVITILSWREGYRLSLAGVAGLIVAIGFTADSFIVYFERIRDELRDGRGLVGAVEAGWKRALRTILAAKSVNLLSAIVLFILAVGNVRGFAFTLGVTTIIDVLVVVLFTHPVLQLLAHHQVLRQRAPAERARPDGARRRLPRACAVPRPGRRAGASQRRVEREEARAPPDHRRTQGRRGRRADQRIPSNDGKDVLMASLSPRFGNDLYTGQALVRLRRQRKLWFTIAACRDRCVVRSSVPDPSRRVQLRHRVPRRLRVPVAGHRERRRRRADSAIDAVRIASCPTPMRRT